MLQEIVEHLKPEFKHLVFRTVVDITNPNVVWVHNQGGDWLCTIEFLGDRIRFIPRHAGKFYVPINDPELLNIIKKTLWLVTL